LFYFQRLSASFFSEYGAWSEKIVIDYTQIANFYSRKILAMLNACDACEHHAVPQVRSLNRTVGTLCPRGTCPIVGRIISLPPDQMRGIQKHTRYFDCDGGSLQSR